MNFYYDSSLKKYQARKTVTAPCEFRECLDYFLLYLFKGDMPFLTFQYNLCRLL